MSNNKISYLNRNFDDYKESLLAYAKQYYPQIADDFDDASIGSWLIDLAASVSDNLSFYIDKAYNETNIDTAQQASSVYNLARTNGFKIPGPKGAMAEVEFSCELPIAGEINNSSSSLGMPNYAYAPIIKKGTKISSKGQIFEVMEDIDFATAVSEQGVFDRTVLPKNANGKMVVKKKATVTAGESKIYKQVIHSSDIAPFMEIIIPDSNVMNVESIIFKDGTNYQSEPSINEFMFENEYNEGINGVHVYRFFETRSLADQYRWGDDSISNENTPKKSIYGYYDNLKNINIPTAVITKGQWIPLTQKFITEFTDKGYLKIIFGSGEQVGHQTDISCANNFSRYQISKMVRNNFLGRLPKEGWTMYVLYRANGGASSNVAKGAINTIVSKDSIQVGACPTAINRQTAAEVRSSLSVVNTTPSVSGKDAPTIEEIKMMTKYSNAAQERCTTIKDYESRILEMPSRYGCPFRVAGIEENNKIMLYVLGIDYNGKLTDALPTMLVTNMTNYLSMYRTINDFVEIKSGRIINVSFEVDVIIDKNYNVGDVMQHIIDAIKNYMDINKHYLNEDIYVGDISREISNIDGVLNLMDLRVYNEFGNGYSPTRTTQKTISDGTKATSEEIDLEESEYILKSDADSMFEIKFPEKDIKIVKVLTR